MSIRFSCPACKSVLNVADEQAGTTTGCDVCGQRVEVPGLQRRQTVVGEIVPNDEPMLLTSVGSSKIHVQCPTCGYETDEPAEFSGKQATCPRCETAFQTSSSEKPGFEYQQPTSAVVVYESPRRRRRSRDDEYDDEEDYRPRRRRRRYYDDDDFSFRCPYCRTKAPPMMGSRISTGGWITFAILLAFCWPLFWIGLLITEPYSRCSRCGGTYS